MIRKLNIIICALALTVFSCTLGKGSVTAPLIENPDKPTDLMASARSSTSIRLNWTDNSSDETHFIIESSSVSGGSFNFIAEVAENTEEYLHTDLVPETEYYYRVIASNSSGNSEPSNEAGAITLPAGSPPVCDEGEIITTCICDGIEYSEGFCCNEEYFADSCPEQIPDCDEGEITETCLCDGVEYDFGFCCENEYFEEECPEPLPQCDAGEITEPGICNGEECSLSYCCEEGCSDSECPPPLTGIPEIDDTNERNIEHGQTYTFTGSNFGSTDNSGGPLRWENFNYSPIADYDGESLEETDYWSTYSDNHYIINPDGSVTYDPNSTEYLPRFSIENLRDSIGLNARVFYYAVCGETGNPDCYGYQSDVFYKNNLDFNPKAFIRFWLRYDYGTSSDPANHHQTKLWRIQTSTGSGKDPEIKYLHTGGWSRYQMDRSGGGGYTFTVPTSALPEHVWSNIALELDRGSQNSENGKLKIWHNGQLLVDEDELLLINNSHVFETVRFGQYCTFNRPCTFTQYFDDIYVDNSWRRIEICDSPFYSSCNKVEMQTPIAWTSSSVTFTANQGAFSTSEAKYLYIVNELGEPSESFEMSFDN